MAGAFGMARFVQLAVHDMALYALDERGGRVAVAERQ